MLDEEATETSIELNLLKLYDEDEISLLFI